MRRPGTSGDVRSSVTAMSRTNSLEEMTSKKERSPPGSPELDKEELLAEADGRGLFHVIEQLAALEGALYSILDGLKSNATHASFFCREYWGTSASQAQLSLEKLNCNERLKRQVQQACVLESLSMGVVSHLCSGVMQGISVTIRSRLRNLVYYVHENCLVLLDLVCQRWLAENPNRWEESGKAGHCPENLNIDVLVRVKRYRRLRRGEHIMALRQHNEMIANVVRQLSRGGTARRPPLSSRSGGTIGSPRARSPTQGGCHVSVMTAVSEILASRTPQDRLRPSAIRSKMLQHLCFRPLLSVEGGDPEIPWPTEDPYRRYGAETFGRDAPTIWYEPLPPMLPSFDHNPKLPPAFAPNVYTLVLDLDETLVHYSECDGTGSYDCRPGMYDFLKRMSQLGYELVIFTAATQDYADWVVDQIDPERLIHHRLYRQHALPWGPIFVKDLSRIGRDLDRTLIIDNVQENFMLQPHNGIFISGWYEDPADTALPMLTPLLEELATTKPKVHEILDRYRDQIPAWAGFDSEADYSEFDRSPGDGDGGGGPPLAQPGVPHPRQHQQQQLGVGPGQIHDSPRQEHRRASPPPSTPSMPLAQSQPQLSYTPSVVVEHHRAEASMQNRSGSTQQVASPRATASITMPSKVDATSSAAGTPVASYVGGEGCQSHPAGVYSPSVRAPNLIAQGPAGYPQQIHTPQHPSQNKLQQQAQQLQQHQPQQQHHHRFQVVGGQLQEQVQQMQLRPAVQGQASQPQLQRVAVAAPSPQGQMRRPVAPAFSASGVSGPYQAQPVSPPKTAAMWGQTGLGPQQMPRHA